VIHDGPRAGAAAHRDAGQEQRQPLPCRDPYPALALEHAGLHDTMRLLPNLDVESAMLGAKSYPETSAQHHALWAAIMLAMVSKKPLEA
jgi:hypothetical protein